MTTPPPDTKVETLDQIAERIAMNHALVRQGPLFNDILSALRNERERCAKVAETHGCELGAPCAEPIADAIREGR